MNYRIELYKISKYTLEKIEELSARLENVHGNPDKSKLIWSIASDFVATIDWSKMGNCLDRYEMYILESSGCLEWVEAGNLDDYNWRNETKITADSFSNYLKNVINFIESNNILKISINDEEIEINLDSEKDTKLFGDLYKMMKDEAMKNNENRLAIEKELVALKEKISDLYDENKQIRDEQFQSEIQSIIDSIVSISGPIGSAILAIYKSSKTGIKYIKASKKIDLDD